MRQMLNRLVAPRSNGLIVSIGGASDIVIARAMALTAAECGAAEVDIAQTFAVDDLSGKKIEGEAIREFALVPVEGVPANLALRHAAQVENTKKEPKDRGKGKRISSALSLPVGQRFVVAGTAGIWSLLCRRPWTDTGPYDFIVGVDGGGDVLGIDKDCDVKVLAALSAGIPPTCAYRLAVVGPGADGTDILDIATAHMPGWAREAEIVLGEDFAVKLEEGLRQASCWLEDVRTWGPDNPEWNYDLKVPQIISLAIRDAAPFGFTAEGHILFPRRGKLRGMRADWLRSTWLFSRNSEAR